MFNCSTVVSISISIYIHWLVVWNIFHFSIYWECHHPNWRTHIFQRGRLNHQPVYQPISFLDFCGGTPASRQLVKHSCCGIDNLAVFLSRARAWAAHVATMPWWRISHDWRDANRSYCITMNSHELPWKILICWWICSNDTGISRSHDRSSLLHPAELIHVLIWSPEGLPWNPHHKESDTQITVGRFSEVRIVYHPEWIDGKRHHHYIYKNNIYTIIYI